MHPRQVQIKNEHFTTIAERKEETIRVTTEIGTKLYARLKGTKVSPFNGERIVVFTTNEWKIYTKFETKNKNSNKKRQVSSLQLVDLLKKTLYKPKQEKETTINRSIDDKTQTIGCIFEGVEDYQIENQKLFINPLGKQQNQIQSTPYEMINCEKDRNVYESDLITLQREDPFEWRKSKDANEIQQQEYYPEAYDASHFDFEFSAKNQPNFRHKNSKRSQEYQAVQKVMKHKFKREI